MLGSVASLRHYGYVQVQFFVDGVTQMMKNHPVTRLMEATPLAYIFVSCFQTPRVMEMTFINCMD